MIEQINAAYEDGLDDEESDVFQGLKDLSKDSIGRDPW